MPSLAITISPPHRPYCKFIHQYKMMYIDDTFIIRHAFKKNRIKRFIIYPELDSKGRLHYHGIINLDKNEYVRFYKSTLGILQRNIGFVDVKQLQSFIDKMRWVTYMGKDFGTTKEILDITNPFLPYHSPKPNKDIQSPPSLTPNILDYFTTPPTPTLTQHTHAIIS